MIPKEGQAQSLGTFEEGQWRGQRIRYRQDRIIVKFKSIPEDSDTTLESVTNRVLNAIPQCTVTRPARKTGRALFSCDASAELLQVCEQLSELDEVEYAEPDIIDSAALVPNDPELANQWGLATIDAPEAWDVETGSATNVLIGIIDSGISMSTAGNLDHPDLNDASRYRLGTDFVDGGVPRDLNGHGTHVAGIAAAETNNSNGVAGMNWGTSVYICRTLDNNGNGSSADFADAVEEIVDFAVDNGLRAVINYSAGGGANQTKEDACRYANDRGMIICAATGNDNAGPVIFPAAYSTQFDGVIAVGATDQNDDVAGFSNVGPEVTVVAPGDDILSTMPTYPYTIGGQLDYDEIDGTSMATPFVTGLLALMWSQNPNLTNGELRDSLINTAVKLGPGDFDNTWGFGRINAKAAVQAIQTNKSKWLEPVLNIMMGADLRTESQWLEPVLNIMMG